MSETTAAPWRTWIGLALGPLLFCLVLLLPIATLTSPAHRLLAVLALVITLWITEAIPLAATALLGPTLCVLLGIGTMKDIFRGFADPIIFVFLGGFLLAEGMLHHGLNRRIAYSILSRSWVSKSPARLLVGFSLVTAVMSLWVSNTATTAMMFPIALAVLKQTEQGQSSFSVRLMLMVAFSASVGGFGTPIGTPPNLIGLGIIQNRLNLHITFFQWMTFGLPLVLVLLLVLITSLASRDRNLLLGAEFLTSERALFGPLTVAERNVIIAFLLTVAMWITPGGIALFIGTQDPIFQWFNSHLPESTAALLGALLLFVLPTNFRQGQFTLTWREAKNIDWGVILLFGGGLALGDLMFSTGLAQWLGEGLARFFGAKSLFGVVALFAFLGMLTSNTTSNVASAAMTVPVAIAVAQGAGVPPLQPALAACLGSSLGNLLPVSTPPNAIVYGSGCIPLLQMVRFGLILDLFGIGAVVAVVMWLVPLVVE
jgi:solute carrier family 13 (sodium-dependent dicarboxylate transporter), member 2/3/5